MKRLQQFIAFLQSRDLTCVTEEDLAQRINSPLVIEFAEQAKRVDDSANFGANSRPASLDVVSPTSPSTDANEWRSPPNVIDAVTAVLTRIDCDPCALPAEWDASVADINYTPSEDGLSDKIAWGDSAWVCPGHDTDGIAWYCKARSEMAKSHLREAIICLPESTLTLPGDLLRFPLAITPKPLTVTFHESGRDVQRTLPTRSLFVYMTIGEPDLDKFAHAFRDIAVAFARVATL